MTRLSRRLAALAGAGLLALTGARAAASPVLLISLDGLRPDDVTQATSRGLKLPALAALMREGAYAEGVTGVLPTLTYPSHTTLVTGVAPAVHGIANNLTFDPLNRNQQGWYWYAADIRVPTLWQAAHAAGLRTANVHWPVTVGAAGIDDNLPQIWRTGMDDDRKLLGALATPGLLPGLEQKLGRYADGIDETVEGDAVRVRFAEALLAGDKPGFMTVYLAGIDHEEHHSGPGSAAANATIERTDALVGELIAAARAAMPDVTIAVVSDHGFLPVATDVNLFAPFIAAGLVTLGRGAVDRRGQRGDPARSARRCGLGRSGEGVARSSGCRSGLSYRGRARSRGRDGGRGAGGRKLPDRDAARLRDRPRSGRAGDRALDLQGYARLSAGLCRDALDFDRRRAGAARPRRSRHRRHARDRAVAGAHPRRQAGGRAAEAGVLSGGRRHEPHERPLEQFSTSLHHPRSC
jgi:hypothetical protein